MSPKLNMVTMFLLKDDIAYIKALVKVAEREMNLLLEAEEKRRTS